MKTAYCLFLHLLNFAFFVFMPYFWGNFHRLKNWPICKIKNVVTRRKGHFCSNSYFLMNFSIKNCKKINHNINENKLFKAFKRPHYSGQLFHQAAHLSSLCFKWTFVRFLDCGKLYGKLYECLTTPANPPGVF